MAEHVKVVCKCEADSTEGLVRRKKRKEINDGPCDSSTNVIPEKLKNVYLVFTEKRWDKKSEGENQWWEKTSTTKEYYDMKWKKNENGRMDKLVLVPMKKRN